MIDGSSRSMTLINDVFCKGTIICRSCVTIKKEKKGMNACEKENGSFVHSVLYSFLEMFVIHLQPLFFFLYIEDSVAF